MARALPKEWDVDLTFAINGAEGIDAIEAGKADILFLDLNMPVMDGYEVLETIRKQDLQTMAIVVSGDIQPHAQERVMNLGALDFVKKPVSKEKITEIFSRYGISVKEGSNKEREFEFDINIRDSYQEIANVAMGQAADLLARLLDVFVVLPIPNVNILEPSELQMALESTTDTDSISAICQGYIGSKIAGEALLIFNDSDFSDIAKLMKYEGTVDKSVELELLMDMANILIGACLKGVADQLNVNFSQGHPIILGQHCKVSDLIKVNTSRWKKTLTIEISYTIENYDISCDLLLLFTEDSIETLKERASLFFE